jgi:hypothetical protein
LDRFAGVAFGAFAQSSPPADEVVRDEHRLFGMILFGFAAFVFEPRQSVKCASEFDLSQNNHDDQNAHDVGQGID